MPQPTICATVSEAVARTPDGASIMVAGFAGAGIPSRLIDALYHSGAKDLTIIVNAIGTSSFGQTKLKTVADLVEEGRVRRVVASFTSSPYPSRRGRVEEMVLSGKIEGIVLPQGTLAERIRAAGAGIPAFYTPAGVGTQLGEGKEQREFDDGRVYVMERALHADYALVHAKTADTAGNLIYRMASRNFNAIMATAAKQTIAEVEEIVPAGTLPPDQVHTPGVYVQNMVLLPKKAAVEPDKTLPASG
jgi:3-oxoacid CoA-transferase A subunit